MFKNVVNFQTCGKFQIKNTMNSDEKKNDLENWNWHEFAIFSTRLHNRYVLNLYSNFPSYFSYRTGYIRPDGFVRNYWLTHRWRKLSIEWLVFRLHQRSFPRIPFAMIIQVFLSTSIFHTQLFDNRFFRNVVLFCVNDKSWMTNTFYI